MWAPSVEQQQPDRAAKTGIGPRRCSSPALVQSNVSMHARAHDPSFIILTLATFLKWRKMLQSALPLVSENMCD